MAAARPVTPVYLEIGKKRVFACALDWPGWSRSGKGEEGALEALAAYAGRYAEVPAAAGIALPDLTAAPLTVVERLTGDMTTDFGAPGAVPLADHDPLDDAGVERLSALLVATWGLFDRIAAGTPAELRKGPRGGGRDRDKMVDHVLAAEAAYARKVGARNPVPALDDAAAISRQRSAILDSLRPASGPAGSGTGAAGWPPRYAARRIAWHVLDHAWEMQDRSTG